MLNPARLPSRLPLLLGALVALVLAAPPALADAIVYRDPETCTETTARVEEIVSETWTEVTYRDRERGPEMSVPSAMVVKMERDATTPEERKLLDAIGELGRGRLGEARRQLTTVTAGGFRQNLESGRLEFQPFTAGDPQGRRTRPPWASEYAHFYYAKALYLEGTEKNDKDLLEQARLALADVPIPGGDGKQTTGGFLGRFEGGNSRFYPEAMLLYARTLVALGQHDDATKAFQALGDQAVAVDIGPRWAYEAKLGPGLIAEAKGNHTGAINAYEDASNFMRLLLRNELRGCYRREIGRYHSRARMEAARVRLEQAEKSGSPTEFQALRNFIDESTPEALERKYSTLPKDQKEALVLGALDAQVQAVMQNGRGLAYMYEKKYEEAVLAFRSVEVKYFEEAEEHARALHYLIEAADKAAAQATGAEARKLYEGYRELARRRLKEQYPDSRWVTGGK